MGFPKKIKDLCTPSAFYFGISFFALLISVLQNFGNTNSYSLGSFSCRVPNTLFVFIFKIMYILFWTWILNLICKDGHKMISWLLVLFPFILFFVIIGLVMINI
jgi:hypothetical protein